MSYFGFAKTIYTYSLIKTQRANNVTFQTNIFDNFSKKTFISYFKYIPCQFSTTKGR